MRKRGPAALPPWGRMPWVLSLLWTMSSLSLVSEACNEAVCASIVSKCTLLKSCECQIVPDQPCTCCDRCQKCLDYLYVECCSCVGLCPRPNATELASRQESVVFEFSEEMGEVVPSLWESLTAASDSRWDAFTYPVDIPPALVKGTSAVSSQIPMTVAAPPTSSSSSSSSSSSPANSLGSSVLLMGTDASAATTQLVTVNCTVAFLTERMAKHKCKSNCVSMGATAGRWFADACCECVGHHCQNYGVAQSRCPGEVDEEEEGNLEELTEEELDVVFQEEQALEELET